ncbi:spermatogenesis-associated protein 48 [Bombina bombina]|uniref:spermatogenesis-associated protein 48 n=1 Tax=Bombina bombina TaxID=8345 RepID=UPI00235AD3F3|nr:spermatogenesis-associated protein 48 [Bombina bombina]
MDQTCFIKFNPRSSAPGMPGYCPHPLRDDVTLLDPCSGFVSAGADAQLRPGTGKSIPSLVDQSDVKPQNTDPWEQNKRMQRVMTAPPTRYVPSHLQRMSTKDTTQATIGYNDFIYRGGMKWNSVARSDTALRANLGGWTSKSKLSPCMIRVPNTSLTQTFIFKLSKGPSNTYEKEEMAKHFMYSTSTQRAFEEVPWDLKLPPKLPLPTSVLDNQMPKDFSLKSNEEPTEDWRLKGGMWDRVQKRRSEIVNRPVTLASRVIASTIPQIQH